MPMVVLGWISAKDWMPMNLVAESMGRVSFVFWSPSVKVMVDLVTAITVVGKARDWAIS